MPEKRTNVRQNEEQMLFDFRKSRQENEGSIYPKFVHFEMVSNKIIAKI